jgi:hypothetical protein
VERSAASTVVAAADSGVERLAASMAAVVADSTAVAAATAVAADTVVADTGN